MKSFVVVERKVASQSASQLRNSLIVFHINVLVFDRFTEPFDDVRSKKNADSARKVSSMLFYVILTWIHPHFEFCIRFLSWLCFPGFRCAVPGDLMPPHARLGGSFQCLISIKQPHSALGILIFDL